MKYGDMWLKAYNDLLDAGYKPDWNYMAEQMIQTLESITQGLKEWGWNYDTERCR